MNTLITELQEQIEELENVLLYKQTILLKHQIYYIYTPRRAFAGEKSTSNEVFLKYKLYILQEEIAELDAIITQLEAPLSDKEKAYVKAIQNKK